MTGESSPQTFGARLHAAIAAHGPLCVGIDPHPSLLRDWNLGDDPAGLERFSRTTVEAVADCVAMLKPQPAFFERHGSAGIAVLERVVADIRAAGGLTLMDAKRGDIGSTMQAYADAYVDPSSALGSDAVTASPYLGFESLRPLLDTARRHGNGVFVLALTSNPEGAQVQRARTAQGRTVARAVLDQVRAENAGAVPWGSVGAVVGATIETAGEDLDIIGPVLAPGYGAQGGTPADLRRIFGSALRHVLPASSRAILAVGPDQVRLRAAAARALEAYRAVLPD
ncbi:MAG TPA: orotidine-5'-phosphate decarboxylase [Jiangellaceae bacterium]|nr:orotidine-5'-phosphate decarboxylase [Jiangellaceae bacterium]